MKNGRCVICLSGKTDENSAVLTFGGYGIPRCLCDKCAEKIDTATQSHDYEQAFDAIQYLAQNMSDNNIDDKATIDTLTDILRKSNDRAEKIKSGTWDFSLDDKEAEDELLEIPEELLETEEDREKDEHDAEVSKKFDKIMNYVCIGIIAAALVFIIFRFLL